MSAGAGPAPGPGRAVHEVSGAPRGGLGGGLPRASIGPVTAPSSSRSVRAAGVAVAVALVAGCGGTTDTADVAATASAPPPSATTQEPVTSTPDSTSSAPAVPAPTAAPADTSADVADAVEPDGLTVTAVRAARQEGHDRVVFELAGSGTPGWRVEYVDTPTSQGSGDAVDVPGTAALQVTLEGVSYPYETGAVEVAREAVPRPDTEHVAGVVYDGTFEGTAVAWIGTAGSAPFRVYSLTGPSRVVVEVVDAG